MTHPSGAAAMASETRARNASLFGSVQFGSQKSASSSMHGRSSRCASSAAKVDLPAPDVPFTQTLRGVVIALRPSSVRQSIRSNEPGRSVTTLLAQSRDGYPSVLAKNFHISRLDKRETIVHGMTAELGNSSRVAATV